MEQPKKLIEFKKLTQAYYTAYCMANVGMKDLRASLLEIEGMNSDGVFQIGEKEEERKAWSEIPTKIALAGMEKDGPFSQMMAQGVITMIYTLWDHEYRGAIAGEVGCEKDDLICSVMGDVRWLRRWIVHRKGVADDRVSKLEVLSWPNESGPIVFGSSEMAELQQAINTMSFVVREQGKTQKRT